ncbi:MAG: PEGA domain-containing protein [Spirochaetota bacterium]
MKAMKNFLVILLAFTVLSGVFAQSRVTLTVIASEGPAQVILSGRLLGVGNPRFVAQVAPGTYDLVVRKPGLPEFKQRITIGSGGLTVNAQLGGAVTPPPAPVPQTFTLTVNSNVADAQVSVNDTALGAAPAAATVQVGNYNIKVDAPGYEPYNATVTVNGNLTHMASLKALAYRTTINANVAGAEVFFNGVKAGTVPFQADLVQGSYNLKVTASGYQDYTAGISVSGSQTINVNLIPLYATITVSVPAQFLNKGAENPAMRIEFYVDGTRVNGFAAQVQPGQRTIRIASGGLSMETVVNLQPGRSYTIEPSFSITVK